jgi:hypothetical protein
MDDPGFSTHAREVLERIYTEAWGPHKLGSPALTLPAKSVLRATDGKFEGLVFIDLRAIIDAIASGLPDEDDGPATDPEAQEK